MAEFLPYSGLEAKRTITWYSGLIIASNARNGIEMRAPSRLRNCKSSKKSPSDAKRSGIRAMSSRRGSETDQNPEGSIEARVALGAICELGSSSWEHFSPRIGMAPECKGLGCGRCRSVGSVEPMATLTSVSDQALDFGPLEARDSCADRSPISGHRNTFPEYFRCLRIHPTLPHLCGANKRRSGALKSPSKALS